MHSEHNVGPYQNLGTDPNDTILSLPLGAAQACRVLVVDDDELVRARLKFYLEKSKFDVSVAGADDHLIKGVPIEEILARVEIARRITHVKYSLRTSNRENRRLAVTDALTGAHNLRYLKKHLPRELGRSQRYRHPLAILSCDIDGFRQVNDRFGHAAGDCVLQAFVARSSNCLRKASDWLARTGGDEFVIVLPETNLQGANLVAQKLLHAYTAAPVSTRIGSVHFGVSIGATALEATHTLAGAPGIEELLRAAEHHGSH